MRIFDYVVVGSGCSGAMAAQTLVEAGKKVVMLDVGESSPQYDSLIPDKDFLSLRTSDTYQYKYFIGEHAEGLAIDEIGKGSQITPTRQFMLRNIDSLIPLQSETFSPIESLGYGGLGISWGLQCWEFKRHELEAAGMDPRRMLTAYETVARRIGISATKDDAASYTLGKLRIFSDSVTMDRNMARIYQKYSLKRDYFLRHGFSLGRTPLALLTEDREGRKKYAYRDMDFYDDNDRSAWRPWITVNELKRQPNFTYVNDFLMMSFAERSATVLIEGLDTKTKQHRTYACKKLILACGALGTARIALRSLRASSSQTLPLLCNPYTYVPCLQPAFFGKAAEPRKIGFGQLSGFLAEEAIRRDTSILTLYSYQSLMLFRIIRQLPLNFVDARILMQYLAPGLIIAGIQHSDRPTSEKFLRLTTDKKTVTGDRLEATYVLSDEELRDQWRREGTYIRFLRKLGVYGIKRLNPGYGSSVHYAGVLPYSKKDTPYTLSPAGRIHGTRHVYVADSSGFRFLPARGLTFSILANAHITAENVLYDGK